jgi:hypothetical protein
MVEEDAQDGRVPMDAEDAQDGTSWAGMVWRYPRDHPISSGSSNTITCMHMRV